GVAAQEGVGVQERPPGAHHVAGDPAQAAVDVQVAGATDGAAAAELCVGQRQGAVQGGRGQQREGAAGQHQAVVAGAGQAVDGVGPVRVGDDRAGGCVEDHVIVRAGEAAGAPVGGSGPVAAGAVDPVDCGGDGSCFEQFQTQPTVGKRGGAGRTAEQSSHRGQ